MMTREDNDKPISHLDLQLLLFKPNQHISDFVCITSKCKIHIASTPNSRTKELFTPKMRSGMLVTVNYCYLNYSMLKVKYSVDLIQEYDKQNYQL